MLRKNIYLINIFNTHIYILFLICFLYTIFRKRDERKIVAIEEAYLPDFYSWQDGYATIARLEEGFGQGRRMWYEICRDFDS